jgi:hypothetical protein
VPGSVSFFSFAIRPSVVGRSRDGTIPRERRALRAGPLAAAPEAEEAASVGEPRPDERESQEEDERRDRRGRDQDPADDGDEAAGGRRPRRHDPPAVVVGRRRGRPLANVERDRRVRDLVAQVQEPAAGLLEVELHLVQLRLHRERCRDGMGAVQELEQLALDRLQVPRASAEVDELLRHVLPRLLSPLYASEAREAAHRLRVGRLGDADDERSAHQAVLALLRRARADDEAAEAGRDRARAVDRRLEVVAPDAERDGRRLDDLRADRSDRALDRRRCRDRSRDRALAASRLARDCARVARRDRALLVVP